MVAVVQAGDATDMIPLLDESLTIPGKYDRGRNNIDDWRRQFIGALVGKASNQCFDWRSGIFAQSGFVGGACFDGQVHQTGGGAGAQSVDIWQFRAIVNRASAGAGPYLVSQDNHKTALAAPAADATNPRKDLLCVMPYDKGKVGSDAQHGPKYIWVTGDPGAVPAEPALPAAVNDALVLAMVNRGANDNTIADADIVDRRKSVGLHGVPRVLMGGDSLGDAGGFHGDMRRRLFTSGITSLTALNEIYERYSTVDSKWHALQPIAMNTPTQSFSGAIANATTQTLATLIIPDMGFPYKINASGGFEYWTTDANALVGSQITLNSTSIDTNVLARGLAKFSDTGAGASKYAPAMADDRANQTVQPGSSATIRFLARNYSAASGITVFSGGQFGMRVELVPV
jgi:hypothetical protein